MAYTDQIIGLILIIFIFLLTALLTRIWISIAKRNNLVGKDMNKKSKHLIPESGGMAVIIGFVISLFLYVLLKIFYFESSIHILETLALIVTMFLAGFIGFGDDILGWKKGISPLKRFLFTIPIAIPLILIKAGTSVINIPFLGIVDLGYFYYLIILIGFVGATNGVNLLAGYNGLEAGLGVIALSALGIISLITGQEWLALISFAAVASLLGFLVYNKYPSRVFPGDSLTFSMGALIASIAILGNMEKIALLIFIPFIIEGFLKLRSKFKAENFAKLNKDGSLEPPYKKNYSLTHLAIRFIKKIKGKAYEKDVVYFLWFIELIISVIAILTIL